MTSRRSLLVARSPVRSAAQARALDAHSIDVVGIPGRVLMEHAGRAVADVVVTRLRAGHSVVVVCGGGNNGGDGFVCARHLLSRGVDVAVLCTHAVEAMRTDAAASFATLLAAARVRGVDVVTVLADADDVGDAMRARLAAARPAVIVDALFGNGLSRPLDGHAAAIVDAINTVRDEHADVVVVAVDVPSGLPTDGQRPTGAVVRADVTVTFGGRKIAHVIEHGVRVCGDVVDVDIGFVGAADEVVDVFVVDGVRLPAADPFAYKKRWGHVGVVVGDDGTRGAALLAAHAAQRAGAGLVTVIGDRTMPRPIELMARDHDDDDAFAVDALVVGPGLSAKAALALRDRVRAARASGTGLFVVADAGALGAFGHGDADVWTPHPGEAARVLGTSSADVEADRVAAARALHQLLGGVVVLKGAAPIVVSATALHVIPGGAAALGVAGAGDVLAGIIGAGLGGAFVSGADVEVEATTIAAVWLHQQAGKNEARGLLASELADNVRAAVAVARG